MAARKASVLLIVHVTTTRIVHATITQWYGYKGAKYNRLVVGTAFHVYLLAASYSLSAKHDLDLVLHVLVPTRDRDRVRGTCAHGIGHATSSYTLCPQKKAGEFVA